MTFSGTEDDAKALDQDNNYDRAEKMMMVTLRREEEKWLKNDPHNINESFLNSQCDMFLLDLFRGNKILEQGNNPI